MAHSASYVYQKLTPLLQVLNFNQEFRFLDKALNFKYKYCIKVNWTNNKKVSRGSQSLVSNSDRERERERERAVIPHARTQSLSKIELPLQINSRNHQTSASPQELPSCSFQSRGI